MPLLGKAADLAMDLATPLATAGLLGVAVAPDEAEAMFLGPLARTANLRKLVEASKMEKAGVTPGEVLMNTGWFKGKDGKWRFEIDDSQARASENYVSGGLDEALNHPELYRAYPDMRNIFTESGINEGAAYGSYQPPTDQFGDYLEAFAPNEKSLRSSLLHEAQHAVQGREGFAAGSNPNAEFSALGRAANWPTANKNYMRSAGEVEARNVESRMDMTPEERKAIENSPFDTEDYPRSEQVLGYGGRGFADPSMLAGLAAASALPAAAMPAVQQPGFADRILDYGSQALEYMDYPLRGLLGIANLPRGLDIAAQTARTPSDETLYGVGQRVTDITGSPLLGTAAYALPQILSP